MWPTPADMVLLKGKPHSEWVQPEPLSVQQIDFYLGRIPEWYIEQKFLKKPGDYLLARGHNNKLRLSIKSHEPGNPAVHLPIEFCQTKQIRGDRNYYYRIEKTVWQNRSVWGLIQSYQKSSVDSLRINTKRDVRLIEPVLPCQGCRYLTTEYSFLHMQIKEKSEINIGDLVCKGEKSTIYKATRYLTKNGLIKTVTERSIILKEMDDCTATVLDDIFREMHIISTIRHQIGPQTVVNVEAIMVFGRPYYIAYALCKKGSLVEYLEKNTVSMDARIKRPHLESNTNQLGLEPTAFFSEIQFFQFFYMKEILKNVAYTLHHCHKISVIHGNLRAENIFVDNDDKTAKPIYYVGGFHHAVIAKSKKVNPNELPNKRWLAPEVLTTKLLTPESDIFAFAFLMYEVLTMKVPHEIIEDKNVLDYISKNPHARPTVPSTVPNWLKELVNECWSTSPEKRPKMSNIWQKLKDNK
ncbi:unnamed protein product [Cercopithifilaria johnstoni]|uniref:Protein kinase domain-containing protein n=1 Tax=Cercopithifilaria johnstoni TaxID=2874296 RepID=A0A8J2Q7Y6_9BILA|nr:unnamed protein product [Cercopithifilaria johnstoni]